ncbi:hypothetical protein ACNKHR_02700 [Shigella flexneri]
MGSHRRPATGHKANTKPLCNRRNVVLSHTMTQTDDLLRKLYDQLRNSGSSFSLVYFSDDGLAFKERGKDVHTLPMMINISKISRCLLWSFPATIKRIG